MPAAAQNHRIRSLLLATALLGAALGLAPARAAAQANVSAAPPAEPTAGPRFRSDYYPSRFRIPGDAEGHVVAGVELQLDGESLAAGQRAELRIADRALAPNAFGDWPAEALEGAQLHRVALRSVSASSGAAPASGARELYALELEDGVFPGRFYLRFSASSPGDLVLLVRAGEAEPAPLRITPLEPHGSSADYLYGLPLYPQSSPADPAELAPMPERLDLQTARFQTRATDPARAGEILSCRTSIGGTLKNGGRLSFDCYDPSAPLSPWARHRIAPSAPTSRSRAIRFAPQGIDDPTGQGRRLFELAPYGAATAAPTRDPYRRFLVLARTAAGRHRLLTLERGELRSSTPLLAPTWLQEQQRLDALARVSEGERNAIRELRRLAGAKLSFDVEGGHVTSLELTEQGDDALAQLAALPHLQSATFTRCDRMSARALGVLEKLSQLTQLDFDDTAVSDAGLAHVVGLPRLESLSVSDDPGAGEAIAPGLHPTDRSLAMLARLRGLRELSLTGEEISDAGLEPLTRLGALRQLTLTGTRATAAGVLYLLSEKEPTSAPLEVELIPGEDDDGVTGRRDEERLELEGRLDDRALAALLELPPVRSLTLGESKQLTSRGLLLISRFSALESLDAHDVPAVTDEVIAALASLPRLRRLDLSGDEGVSDAGLALLSRLPRLEKLDVSAAGASEAAVAALRLRLPGCEIEH